MRESGIILVVPEAEPLVRDIRIEHDRVARLGVPAHVTLLYPWVTQPISQNDLDRLATALRGIEPYELTFRGLGRFERALYLRPDDRGETVALIERLTEAFPDHRPYGGQFTEHVPHLTVADLTSELQPAIDGFAAQLLSALPITAEVTTVTVMESDDEGVWTQCAQFTLANKD